jgi:catechol 2,3-dioxygenase-like lactoylglutathione lyase family enzyme
MKLGFLGAVCCALFIIAASLPLSAQLAPPNAAGVALGAVYYTVPDVETHRKIWVDIFGAKPVMVGKTEMLKLPGVFIVLTKGEPAAGNPLINHLGIWAKDLDPTRAKLTAAGVQTAPKAQFVDLPNALRLEFIDDPAGPDAPAAHHIHYFVASQQAGLDARAWYVKTFGAAENARRNGAVPSALFTPPDKWISIDFTAAGGGRGGRGGRGGAAPPPAAAAPAPAGPTSNKGTILDRFALEIRGLDAFVKKIEAEGVKVTKPVSTNADGLKTAMIADSLGNDVELVEGLAGK